MIAVIILVGFFAIVDFVGFVYGSLNHIGTTEFQGDTYHFVDYYVFDDRSKIYLGKCENTKYRCQFDHIYSVYTVYTASTTHDFELNNNGDALRILVDGELVFTYDGEQETCINQFPRKSGFCPKPMD